MAPKKINKFKLRRAMEKDAIIGNKDLGSKKAVETMPAPPGPGKLATTKRQRREAKALAAAAASGSPLSVAAAAVRPAAVVKGARGPVSKKRRRRDAEEEMNAPRDQPPEKTMRTKDQHYGPPVGVKTMSNDEWQTCLSAWEALKPILGPRYRQKRIWQPFFYDGECCKHLSSLGFEQVKHSQEDFFKKVLDKKFMATVDFIWDNPPYTNQEIKEKVLRACEASGKPFCLLLPISVLHSQFIRDVLDMTKIQVIMPRKVFVKKANQEPLPFKYLVWLCYKANLQKDLYLI